MATQLFTPSQTTSDALTASWWVRLISCLLCLILLPAVALAQTKLWDRTLGGSNSEALADIFMTADGGYLIGGTSFSERAKIKLKIHAGEKITGS